MKIPKSFKLMGKIYTVEDMPNLIYSDAASGMAYHRSRRIGLQTSSIEYPIPDEDREQSFLHELTHHILHVMKETKLNDNEKFVDMFAGFLHQALTTMEYDEEERFKDLSDLIART